MHTCAIIAHAMCLVKPQFDDENKKTCFFVWLPLE